MNREQRNRLMVCAALVFSLAALLTVFASRGRSATRTQDARAVPSSNGPGATQGATARTDSNTDPATEKAKANLQYVDRMRADVANIERFEQQHLDQVVFAIEGFDDIVVQRWGVAMAVRNLEHAKMDDPVRNKLQEALFRAADSPNWRLRRSVAANLTGCKLLGQASYRDLVMDLRADTHEEVADRAKRTTLPGEPEIR